VLAVGSVGSLSPELPVGSLLCPDDFIALGIGPSVFADARAHSAPGFDPRWRDEVIEAWRAGGQAPRDGGVYWQTRGPRFETPAEIGLIAAHADVVGMTIASECVVAGELGLDYAALCVVDNLANGIGGGELDVAGLEDDRIANATRLRDGLAAVLPQLGAVGR
jgi:5'-methylthioadenosine phosphorylase